MKSILNPENLVIIGLFSALKKLWVKSITATHGRVRKAI